MNTPGTDTGRIVIGDSDALIALLHEGDGHFAVARATVEELIRQQARVNFPLTAIVETVTTLQRKPKRPQFAGEVIQNVLSETIEIELVDKDLLKQAADDRWYEKQGLTLATQSVQPTH